MKRADGKDWGTLVPDRVFGINYSWDYKQHDKDYAIGSGKSRLSGDIDLFKNMIKSGQSSSLTSLKRKKHIKAIGQAAWSPVWATINFIGLRVGGWKFYGKSK